MNIYRRPAGIVFGLSAEGSGEAAQEDGLRLVWLCSFHSLLRHTQSTCGQVPPPLGVPSWLFITISPGWQLVNYDPTARQEALAPPFLLTGSSASSSGPKAQPADPHILSS